MKSTFSFLGDVYEKNGKFVLQKRSLWKRKCTEEEEEKTTPQKGFQIVRHVDGTCIDLVDVECWCEKFLHKVTKWPYQSMCNCFDIVFFGANKLLCKFDNVEFCQRWRVQTTSSLDMNLKAKWIQLEIKIKTLSIKPFDNASYLPDWVCLCMQCAHHHHVWQRTWCGWLFRGFQTN